MARAPFQTLVIPYRLTEEGIRYAVFLRSDGDFWQWIADSIARAYHCRV